MKDYLDFATELAEKAGEITLRYFGVGVHVETKADLSPVTIADRSAEEFIRNEIDKRFPDDGILGEEFGEKKGKSGYRWLIDPIDGTKSFIRSAPLYGTMIAVEHQGEVPVGVIRYPPNRMTLSAMTGGGCHCNGVRVHVSAQSQMSASMVVMTDLVHFAKFLGPEAFQRVLRETGLIRTWGDCFGYYLVATGQADIMIDPIINAWDIAACLPIIKEAGGMMTDLKGHSNLHIHQTVASNGLLHDAMVAMLKGEGGRP